ncbi:serine hydrolase domain-containing protein [Streptomyces sp. NPDC056361]|uniref:serine hydrolase domain-containing protein n=1 Tax=Streptomyces sp. NPDC056361 TaxID=3345795 RepID=UPI0035DD7098
MTNSTNSWMRKVRWPVAAAAAALAVAGTAVAPAAASTGTTPVPLRPPAAVAQKGHVDPAALRDALAGLPDDYVRGAMARVTGREGRWRGTAGEWTVPDDAEFAIGSITKLFTSAIALQLVGEGRLAPEDTVQELLPGLLPASYEPITVGQLLSHTSGLQKPRCVRPGTPVEVVTSAVSCGTPTAPGSAVQYNGINTFLVGLVIEKVTGRSYGEELRDRITRPLGLRHTSLPADDWAWAEGGIVSRASDLERFFTALIRGRLLRPTERGLLFTTPETPGADFSYGGLRRVQAPGGGPVVWGKTGSNHGYTSGIFATPDLGRVVVYSTLTTGENPDEETARVLRIAGAGFRGAGTGTTAGGREG